MVDFQKTPISLLQFVAYRKSNKRKDLAELYDYFKLNELSEQQVQEKIFIKMIMTLHTLDKYFSND